MPDPQDNRQSDPPREDARREPRPATPAIVDLVFEDRRDRPFRRTLVATMVVAAVYGGAGLSMRAPKTGRTRSNPTLASRMRADPSPDRTVDLLPPPLASPLAWPTAKNPTPIAAVHPAIARTSGRPSRRAPPVSPAPAAPVMTRAAPAAPLDLTGDTVVSGGAARFPGGATAAGGRSNVPIGGAVDVHAPASRRPTLVAPVLTRPVSLNEGTWVCPWPVQADAEQIDEQTVVIRVRVAADGGVDAAEVVSDPGAGFGRAALACARRTRFQPARDPGGNPTAAWSPPIRVHFAR